MLVSSFFFVASSLARWSLALQSSLPEFSRSSGHNIEIGSLTCKTFSSASRSSSR